MTVTSTKTLYTKCYCHIKRQSLTFSLVSFPVHLVFCHLITELLLLLVDMWRCRLDRVTYRLQPISTLDNYDDVSNSPWKRSLYSYSLLSVSLALSPSLTTCARPHNQSGNETSGTETTWYICDCHLTWPAPGISLVSLGRTRPQENGRAS